MSITHPELGRSWLKEYAVDANAERHVRWTVAGALVEGVIVSFGAGCSGILIVQPVLQWRSDYLCLEILQRYVLECHLIRHSKAISFKVIRTRFVAGVFLFAGTSSKVFASETLCFRM